MRAGPSLVVRLRPLARQRRLSRAGGVMRAGASPKPPADAPEGVALLEAMILEQLCYAARCTAATLGGGNGAAARGACWRHMYGGITVWLDLGGTAGPQKEAYEQAEIHLVRGGSNPISLRRGSGVRLRLRPSERKRPSERAGRAAAGGGGRRRADDGPARGRDGEGDREARGRGPEARREEEPVRAPRVEGGLAEPGDARGGGAQRGGARRCAVGVSRGRAARLRTGEGLASRRPAECAVLFAGGPCRCRLPRLPAALCVVVLEALSRRGRRPTTACTLPQ